MNKEFTWRHMIGCLGQRERLYSLEMSHGGECDDPLDTCWHTLHTEMSQLEWYTHGALQPLRAVMVCSCSRVKISSTCQWICSWLIHLIGKLRENCTQSVLNWQANLCALYRRLIFSCWFLMLFYWCTAPTLLLRRVKNHFGGFQLVHSRKWQTIRSGPGRQVG